MLVTDKSNIKNINTVSYEERDVVLQKEDLKKYKKGGCPYRRYRQENMDYDDFLFSIKKNHLLAGLLFDFLVKEMSEYNVVVCSYTVLQEALGVKQASIARAIKTLKDNKVVEVFKIGNLNGYAINADIKWRTHGYKTKHARFKAHIRITETEQDKALREKINKEKEILNKGKVS